MFKTLMCFLNILFLFLIVFSSGYAQTNEQITLTTYYPSPQGSYVELRSKRLALGEEYLSPVSYCWPPLGCANVINANADLVVEGTVGIGTINPSHNLSISAVGGAQAGISLDSESLTHIHFGSSTRNYQLGKFGSPNDNFFISDQTAGGLVRFLITPQGNIGIGTSAPNPTAKLDVFGDLYLSGPDEGAYRGLYLPNGDITVDGGTDGVFGFLHSGNGASTINFGTPYWPPNTWTMTINTTTGLVGIGTQTPAYQLELSQDSAAKPTSNTWQVPSDKRVKKEIEPFNDGLDVINQINPVRYKLNGKAGLPLNKEGISVIAQDIKDVAPYTIKTWKAKLEPTDTEKTELYDFDSSPLTFVIINAIKEQQRKIERLEAEIVELKSRLSTSE